MEHKEPTQYDHSRRKRPSRQAYSTITKVEEKSPTIRVSLNPYRFIDEPRQTNFSCRLVYSISHLIQSIINKTSGIHQETQLDRIHSFLQKVDTEVDETNYDRKRHEQLLQELQMIPIDDLVKFTQKNAQTLSQDQQPLPPVIPHSHVNHYDYIEETHSAPQQQSYQHPQ